MKKELKSTDEMHKIYHKFCKWIKKTFGTFDVIGYEAMEKIENYVKKNPEIKIVECDDDINAGSILLLIPHPKFGITVMFIPQCTSVQNTFFLYEGNCEQLIKTLTDMKSIYRE